MSTKNGQGINSLNEWRLNKQCVAWAQKTFDSDFGRLLVSLMQETEHVRLYDDPTLDASRKLGRIEGWDLYNSTLRKAMISLATIGEMPEATFEKPEEQAKPAPKEDDED